MKGELAGLPPGQDVPAKKYRAQLIVIQAAAEARGGSPPPLSAFKLLDELQLDDKDGHLHGHLAAGGWENGQLQELLNAGEASGVPEIEHIVHRIRPIDIRELLKNVQQQWEAKDLGGLDKSLVSAETSTLLPADKDRLAAWRLATTIANPQKKDQVERALSDLAQRLAQLNTTLAVPLSEALDGLATRDGGHADEALKLARRLMELDVPNQQQIKQHVDNIYVTRVKHAAGGHPQAFEPKTYYEALERASTEAQGAIGETDGLVNAALAESKLELGQWDSRGIGFKTRPDASAYERYVGVLMRNKYHGDADPEELLAVAALATDAAAADSELSLPHRREQLATLLFASAARLRKDLSPDKRTLGAILEPYPAGADQAGLAFRLLKRSFSLAQTADPPFLINLAAASYFSRDANQALRAISRLSPDRTSWGNDAPLVDYVRYAAQPETPAGLESLRNMVDALLGTPPPVSDADSVELYKLIDTAVAKNRDKAADKAYAGQLARLYYQQCKLIRGAADAAWPFADRPAQALGAVNQALKLEPANNEYLIERARGPIRTKASWTRRSAT